MRLVCFVVEFLCLLTNIMVPGIQLTEYPVLFIMPLRACLRLRSSCVVSNSCTDGCATNYHAICWYNANVDTVVAVERSLYLSFGINTLAELFRCGWDKILVFASLM